MDTVRTTIFLNEGEGNFFGYKPEHAPHLDRVTTLAFAAGRDDTYYLEMAFQVGNGADPESESQYYVHGKRSVSVGDVVRLDYPDRHATYACDSFGWTEIPCTPATCEIQHNAEVHSALDPECCKAHLDNGWEDISHPVSACK